MIEASLEVLDFRRRNVNLDRIKRARRGCGAEMIVVIADLLLPRQAVSAEKDSRERGSVDWRREIRRHV